jgi:hypothetical protein
MKIKSFIAALFILVFVSFSPGTDHGQAHAKTYKRSCKAQYWVIPSRGHRVSTPQFSAQGRVGHYAPNKARRRARKKLNKCVNAHWRHRNSNARPSECTSANSVSGYPISGSLENHLKGILCYHNPGITRIRANVSVSFSGDRGCDGIDPGTGVIGDPMTWTLDHNHLFICPEVDQTPLH